jgi:predicted PurR-regulated permease PerM
MKHAADGAANMPKTAEPRVALELPWRTIFKLLAAIALVWCWLHLVTLFLLVVVAVLLAVTLDPLVQRLEARGVPRWGGSTLVVLGLVVIIVGFVIFASTQLSGQAQMVGGQLQKAEHQLIERIPPRLRAEFSADSAGTSVQSYIGPLILRLTQGLGSALIVFALAAILTLYLLIEGDTTYAWLLAFVPPARRGKVSQTAIECQRVIFGYVAGNVATSVFATIFVFIVLTVLKVPAALLLALLAGVFDFVPVLGFILSVVPAFVLALTVSPLTALIVLLLYIAYHTIENYLIAPWVYGDRLQLSNIAVVLAFAVGAELAGVVGALIALPIAAAYPAIERIWLKEQLGEQVVQEHRSIARKAG